MRKFVLMVARAFGFACEPASGFASGSSFGWARGEKSKSRSTSSRRAGWMRRAAMIFWFYCVIGFAPTSISASYASPPGDPKKTPPPDIGRCSYLSSVRAADVSANTLVMSRANCSFLPFAPTPYSIPKLLASENRASVTWSPAPLTASISWSASAAPSVSPMYDLITTDLPAYGARSIFNLEICSGDSRRGWIRACKRKFSCSISAVFSSAAAARSFANPAASLAAAAVELASAASFPARTPASYACATFSRLSASLSAEMVFSARVVNSAISTAKTPAAATSLNPCALRKDEKAGRANSDSTSASVDWSFWLAVSVWSLLGAFILLDLIRQIIAGFGNRPPPDIE